MSAPFGAYPGLFALPNPYGRGLVGLVGPLLFAFLAPPELERPPCVPPCPPPMKEEPAPPPAPPAKEEPAPPPAPPAKEEPAPPPAPPAKAKRGRKKREP